MDSSAFSMPQASVTWQDLPGSLLACLLPQHGVQSAWRLEQRHTEGLLHAPLGALLAPHL